MDDYIAMCENNIDDLKIIARKINRVYPSDLSNPNQIRNGLNIAHHIANLEVGYGYLIDELKKAKNYE
jgi:hypothetical protein